MQFAWNLCGNRWMKLQNCLVTQLLQVLCLLLVLHWLVSGKIQWKELPILVLMKIIVHPLLVWLLAVIVFGLNEEIWIKVLVILAALPTGVNPFLFCKPL